MIKICKRCGIAKTLDEFRQYKGRKGILYRRGRCIICEREEDAEYKRKYSDKIKLSNRKSKAKRKEQIKIYNKEYHEKNKVKLNEKRRIWRLNPAHNEKKREYMRKYYIKKQKRDPLYALNKSISLYIRETLKNNGGSKKNRHWEDVVGYTVLELRKHLEKQFIDGMSWDNYGTDGWHIDHIIPVAVFNYSSPEHIDFKRCWSLSNLQPLWAKDNLSKGKKLDESFQPSLAI